MPLTELIRQTTIEDPFNERLLDELGNILREQMRIRGLWEAPPELVGYPGDNWEETGEFEEITIDCYNKVIIQQIYNLQQRLKQQKNIDLVVIWKIKHFLMEQQTQHDPLGYAVTSNIKDAIQKVVRANILSITGLDQRRGICERTTLFFIDQKKPDINDQGFLDTVLHSHTNWLNLRLTLAQITPDAQKQLYELILQLHHWGVKGFRYNDFLIVMVNDVRQVQQ